MDNVYNELYTVQLTYEQVFVDHRGVRTRQNVVRQMATPPIAHPLFSVNRKVFGVYGFFKGCYDWLWTYGVDFLS